MKSRSHEPHTFVPAAAHTHQVVGVGQEVAAVRELSAAARPVRTHAGAAALT